MSANTLNVDGVMLFEQPFARVSTFILGSVDRSLKISQVPYENYRKVFRTSQKSIEKELGALQTSATELARKARAGGCHADEAVKAIDAMVKRAENLKRKVYLSLATQNSAHQKLPYS